MLSNALVPTATLHLPVVIENSVPLPIPILYTPPAEQYDEFVPIPMLLHPAHAFDPARQPIKVLQQPVVPLPAQ